MRPLITLTTDFGLGSYVAQMKGVLYSLCPDARIVDVDHSLPPQDVASAVLLLRDVVSVYPAGTIHVVVVDPGVGTRRRGLVLRAGNAAPGQYFVGPDNGIFADFVDGGVVHHVTAREYMRESVSPTFHGRDVFSPVAAHLATGVTLEQFGPRVHDAVRLELPRPTVESDRVIGEVMYADHFGNVITNITSHELPRLDPAALVIEIGPHRIDGLRTTYAEVEQGELLALMGSSGRLEIAVRDGSAVDRLALQRLRGAPVVVSARSARPPSEREASSEREAPASPGAGAPRLR